MKKIITLLTLSLLFIACSDEKLPILPPLNSILENDEVRMVFIPTAEQPQLLLNVVHEGGETLSINWGEDDRLHTAKHGEISHIYTELDRPYTISIRPHRNESKLTTVKIETPKVAQQIRSLRFGKSDKFMSFNMHILENQLERLDLSQNPQFFHGLYLLYVNTPNFVFEDCQHFANISLSISLPISVRLEGLDAQNVNLNYTLKNNHFDSYLEINLSNSTIERLSLASYIEYNQNAELKLEDLDLSNSIIGGMTIADLYLEKILDLSTTKYCEGIELWRFEAKKIILPSTLEFINITHWSKNRNLLEELDLRNCINLKYAFISNSPNLKNIHYTMTDKISYLGFYNNAHIEEVSYKKEETLQKAKTTKSYINNTKGVEVLQLQGK